MESWNNYEFKIRPKAGKYFWHVVSQVCSQTNISNKPEMKKLVFFKQINVTDEKKETPKVVLD